MTWARKPPRERQYEGAWSPEQRKHSSRVITKVGPDYFVVGGMPPPVVPIPKQQRHESTPWRRAVASLPCVLCGKEGETQCAHRNEGKSMSLKTDDATSAALCQTCHREIDQGKTMTREERRATMDRAIVLTVAEMARRGLVRAV